MKTLAQKAQEFRTAKGWNTTQMANAVGTSRQNIENLETKEVGQPRYIRKLAFVMGVSVDELLGQHIATPSAKAGVTISTDNPVLTAPAAMSPALHIEAIAQALVQMTDAQREAMAGKLASLARAPDSPTLKKSISDLLSTPAPAAGAPPHAGAAQVAPQYQQELNQLTQAAEARRDDQNRKQRNSIPRDGTTGH